MKVNNANKKEHAGVLFGALKLLGVGVPQ